MVPNHDISSFSRKRQTSDRAETCAPKPARRNFHAETSWSTTKPPQRNVHDETSRCPRRNVHAEMFLTRNLLAGINDRGHIRLQLISLIGGCRPLDPRRFGCGCSAVPDPPGTEKKLRCPNSLSKSMPNLALNLASNSVRI